MDMDTASPPVSPRVVAAILIIQNRSVTSGTLLSTALVVFLTFKEFMGLFLSIPYFPHSTVGASMRRLRTHS